MATKTNKQVDKKEVVEPKLKKPKIPTSKYKLIKDVVIGDVLTKKGKFVELTEEGKRYFKKQFYIK